MNKFLKATAVVIILIITFVNFNSCKEQEDLLESTEQENKILPKMINFKEFLLKNEQFNKKGELSKIKQDNRVKGLAQRTLNNLEIEEENVQFLELGNYKSYTFKIKSDLSKEVKNLLIETQKDEIRVSLLTYKISETFWRDYFSHKLSALPKPTIQNLNIDDFKPLIKDYTQREGCTEVYVWAETADECGCNGGESTGEWEFAGWDCVGEGFVGIVGGDGNYFGNTGGDLNPIPIFGTIPSWATGNNLPDFNVTTFFPPQGTDVEIMLTYGPTNFTPEQQTFINDENNSPIVNYLANIFRITGYSEDSKTKVKWAIDYLNNNSNAKDYFNENPQDLDFLFEAYKLDSEDRHDAINVLLEQREKKENNTLNDNNWPFLDKLIEKLSDAFKVGVIDGMKKTRAILPYVRKIIGDDKIKTYLKPLLKLQIEKFRGPTNTDPKTMGWEDLLYCWLFEIGGNLGNPWTGNMIFKFDGTAKTLNHPTPSLDLSKHNSSHDEPIKKAMDFVKDQIKKYGISSGSHSSYWHYKFSDLGTGNVMEFLLGSYSGTFTWSFIGGGKYKIHIKVNNTTGWTSGTRIPNPDGSFDNGSILQNIPRGQGFGMGGTVEEVWEWDEIYTP